MSLKTSLRLLRTSPAHISYGFAVVKALLLVCLVAAFDDMVCGHCGIEGPLIVIALCIAVDAVHFIRDRRRGFDQPWRWQIMIAVYALLTALAVGLWVVVRRGLDSGQSTDEYLYLARRGCGCGRLIPGGYVAGEGRIHR